MSEPVLTQASVTASVGGKVQIQKYVLDSSYFVSESRTYSIPDDWSEEQAQEFLSGERSALRERVEEQGQTEFNERWDQSDANPERGK